MQAEQARAKAEQARAQAVQSEIQLKMVNALDGLKKATREVHAHAYVFLDGSKHANLRTSNTCVDVLHAESLAPDPNDKSECSLFLTALNDKVCAFVDDLTTHAFVKARNELAAHVYALTCLRETLERGDDYAFSAFLRSFTAVKKSTGFRHLTRVVDKMRSPNMRSGPGHKLDTLFECLDTEFVADSKTSCPTVQ